MEDGVVFKVFLGAIAFVIILTNLASAENVVFRIGSNHRNIVSLKFFSQDRSHVWPNADEVYLLKDSATHRFNLRCRRNESVCYGAWVRGIKSSYWGVGPSNKNSCTNRAYPVNADTHYM